MSDKIDDGGPAFPHVRVERDGSGRYKNGMPLRDYFAAQALPTVLGLIGIPERDEGPDDLWDAEIAKRCFAMADAMLKERDWLK